MNSNELTVLKLGGSVITLKDKPLTPNMSAIERISSEISSSQVAPLIIIHGGGSFGHPVAARYEIAGGFRDKGQMVGFSETRNSMITLNMLVVKSLLDRGLPAIGIAPSAIMISNGGRIGYIYRDILDYAIKLGFMPVLYGDAVFDYDMGFTVISGDQITSKLAVELNAKRIIVGVDVDGLYTDDPKVNPNAHLITYITVNELKSMTIKVGGSRSIDVTGGMLGKVSELIHPASMGIEVLIVNALKPNNIYRALKGESVVGTRIVRG